MAGGAQRESARLRYRIPALSTANGVYVHLHALSEEGHADVNSIRLHYVSRGTGPLILFLHGFPEFWYAWRNQLIEFGADYQAVAVDMRGYNLSSKPGAVDEYGIGKLVEDVGALADHLGAKTFVLVGHDWGGVVAWAFALAHPDRLEKLVIINAPHPVIFTRELTRNRAQQKASAYILLLRIPGAEIALAAFNFALLRKTMRGVFASTRFSDADIRAYVDAWSQPGALGGALKYYRAVPLPRFEVRSSADMPRATSPPLSVPTLVLWGERDPYLLPTCLHGLHELVRHLTIRRIPDATHWVIHEQPDVVNAAIRAFLGNSASSASSERGAASAT